MSDLQCAAVVLVARHAEAAYDVPVVLGDEGGRLTDRGREQALALAAELHGRRVAAVCSSHLSRAVETAEVVAGALGVDAHVLPGLEEFSVGTLAGRADGEAEVERVFESWLCGDLGPGCPGAESGFQVVERFRTAVGEVADSFRGETVLLVSHGGIMSIALPRIAFDAHDDIARARWVPHCGMAEVHVDSDGWSLTSWPGRLEP